MGTTPYQIAAAAHLAHKAGNRAVADIGAQDIHGAITEAEMEAANFPDGTDIHGLAASRSVAQMFAAKGVRYVCFDLFQAPAGQLLDLNTDPAPESWRGIFGAVCNFGTTEHVFNQANAFRVIHDLCAVGGYMWHNLPMSHFWGHGFFKYDAHFFFALERANGYEVCHMRWHDEPAARAPLQDYLTSRGLKVAAQSRFVASDVLFRKTHDAPFRMPTDLDGGRVAPSLADRYAALE